MTGSATPWRIWVDTGGTFTDCLAVSPAGEVRRAKVLSSGALRGMAIRALTPDAFEVAADWLPHAGVVRGFRFRLLDARGGDRAARVRELDPETGTIYLDAPVLPVDLPAPFELLSPEEAPLLAARLVTGTAAGDALPPIEMRLATTRGTNALLERKGAAMALFVTRGFGDLLPIGTQQRPDLFALRIERDPSLPVRTVQVTERIAADGSILTPLDEVEVSGAAERLVAEGIAVAAVAFVNGYRNPAHEWRVAELLRRAGFRHVSASAELSSAIHLLERAQTACVDAYLAPLFDDYLGGVTSAIGAGGRGSMLRVMTSAGGLVGPAAYRPKDSLLSGPAAGIVGASGAGRSAGFPRILSFDMGGTSTDVARFDGDYDYAWRHEVGGVQLLAPALAIESVAAGGGSICDFVAGGVTVGPASAGAHPGPACYGAGGPLTVTDCNLLLGRLDPTRFGIPISREAALGAARALLERVEAAAGAAPGLEAFLEGLVEIADERMADAMRGMSVRKGFDPAEYAIVAFGGAGGQHACGVAGRLGVRTIVVPPDAALLSARGLGAAAVERIAERHVLRPLGAHTGWVDDLLREAGAEAREALAADGVPTERITIARRVANLRVLGQNTSISVDVEDAGELHDRFRERYFGTFGFPPRGEVEVESLRVIARGVAGAIALERPSTSGSQPPGAYRTWIGGAWRDIPALQRAALSAGTLIDGPALLFDPHTTIVIHPEWRAEPAPDGALVICKSTPVAQATTAASTADRDPGSAVEDSGVVVCDNEGETERMAESLQVTTKTQLDTEVGVCNNESLDEKAEAKKIDKNGSRNNVAFDNQSVARDGNEIGTEIDGLKSAVGPEPDRNRSDPIEEQLFTSRFEALVGEMGDRLQRTALSVNVKERLDFSCALLNAEGELVANAPHIPVHLGALGLCVRAIRDAIPLAPGDVVVTNHPAFGGSHLPDITVVTPSHTADGRLIGYVASRAHHAEIGGTRPGSMPPDARTLAEEGVVIPPTHLIREGTAQWEAVEGLFTSARHPSRAPADNMADLRAQVAANHRGAMLLRRLAESHGADDIHRYMAALTARCERLAREALSRLPRGRHTAAESLDDGSALAVAIESDGDGVTFDFSGTAPVHPANLNATPAIVRSAILYLLRLLIDEPVPLNEGLLRPVRIVLPESLLNPPFTMDPARDPAVVGGNTEVSQRLVDTLLKALGVAACSQGTMNNVLWGADEFGYYETIGGGAGAGPGFAGASGVHTHMTNTRITDVEVMEHRYPVRLWRFEIRRGSGGEGKWPGGDGIVRETEFLAPMKLSILAQHRRERPYGAAGGRAGLPGAQRVVRANGTTEELQGVDGCDVGPGDRLIVETPGGGGWGA